MTNYESAIDEIAGRLQGADASLTSSVAEMLAGALQEAELTGTIGAQHGERSQSRTAQRNGQRSKLLSTPAGDLEVAIPKLRGQLLPGTARATVPDRQALWPGDHDLVHLWNVHPEGR